VTQSPSNVLKLAKLQASTIADAIAAELARAKHPRRLTSARWTERRARLQARLETQHDFIARLDRELAATDARAYAGAPRLGLTSPQRTQRTNGLPDGSYCFRGKGGYAPFGYERRKMPDGSTWIVPIPDQQAAVARMVEMRRSGETILAIQASMAAEGFKLSRSSINTIIERAT
jgi:hypothetical protein